MDRHSTLERSVSRHREARRLSPGTLLVWGAVGVLLVALFTLIGGPQASATAREVRADRADNNYYFTYDASTGTLTTESSSLQERRRDPVSHRIYVDSVPGAVVGERLKAVVRLRLNVNERHRFNGALDLEVRDAAGQMVYNASQNVDFTLRPKKGYRGHKVIFLFDLPSGDYAATSFFKAPSP